MKIAETFMSIQGEGPHTGRPAFFVRTVGCNLACDWCDTVYAREGGTEMSVNSIMDLYLGETFKYGRDSGLRMAVCITGGEPMLQPDVNELIAGLLATGAPVEMMTNGSVSLASISDQVHLIVDIKTDLLIESADVYPAAGFLECGRPGPDDCVKFVVASRKDFEKALAWADSCRLFDRVGDVRATPAWGQVEPAEVVQWILSDCPRFRLGIQQHKYIWGPQTRL